MVEIHSSIEIVKLTAEDDVRGEANQSSGEEEIAQGNKIPSEGQRGNDPQV